MTHPFLSISLPLPVIVPYNVSHGLNVDLCKKFSLFVTLNQTQITFQCESRVHEFLDFVLTVDFMLNVLDCVWILLTIEILMLIIKDWENRISRYILILMR